MSVHFIRVCMQHPLKSLIKKCSTSFVFLTCATTIDSMSLPSFVLALLPSAPLVLLRPPPVPTVLLLLFLLLLLSSLVDSRSAARPAPSPSTTGAAMVLFPPVVDAWWWCWPVAKWFSRRRTWMRFRTCAMAHCLN